MDEPHAQTLHEHLTDLDLQILDVLREDNQSTQLLATTLSREGEQVEVAELRRHLEKLSSSSLVRPLEETSPSDESGSGAPSLAKGADSLWGITQEGRMLIEPHTGVAHAPYDRDVSGGEEVDDERDVGSLVVLLLIALVTGACAAYSLLRAAGVI